MYFSTPPLAEPQRGSQVGNRDFHCARKMHSAQHPHSPPPFAPILSTHPRPPHCTWGGKSCNSPEPFTFKWETRFLLGKQRVKAIRAPSSGEPGPPRRRVLCHLLAATGLARPLPLSRASLPLLSSDPRKVSGWVCPGSARLRKPDSGPGVPDAGGGTQGPQREEGARPSPRRPGAGRAWGPGAAAQAAATSREPTPTWHRARWRFFPQLQRGAGRVGGLGVPSLAPGREVGARGPAGAGAKWEASQRLGRDG